MQQPHLKVVPHSASDEASLRRSGLMDLPENEYQKKKITEAYMNISVLQLQMSSLFLAHSFKIRVNELSSVSVLHNLCKAIPIGSVAILSFVPSAHGLQDLALKYLDEYSFLRNNGREKEATSSISQLSFNCLEAINRRRRGGKRWYNIKKKT